MTYLVTCALRSIQSGQRADGPKLCSSVRHSDSFFRNFTVYRPWERPDLPLSKFARAMLGLEVKKEFLPMQDGDVPDTFASAGLLETLTDYRPSAPTSAGILAFADWYRAFRNKKEN